MSRPHGRARYIWGPGPGQVYGNGCRCFVCCEANRAYARYQRKRKSLEGLGRTEGPWAPPFVDAGAARLRLLILGDHGIGYKRVAELAGLGHTAVHNVRSGRKMRIRRETSDAILAVTLDVAQPAGGARIDARPTWKLVRLILRQPGWTKARLGLELGQAGYSLQLGKRSVTVRNAAGVARVAEELGLVEQPGDDRRFDVDPLLRFGTIAELARQTGVHGSQFHRWKKNGIPATKADAVAVAMGCHPAEIWPDWYASEEAA